MATSKKGMGFDAAARSAGKGDMKKGARIIAASSRNASSAAKKKNPNLLKVSGARKSSRGKSRKSARK